MNHPMPELCDRLSIARLKAVRLKHEKQGNLNKAELIKLESAVPILSQNTLVIFIA